MRKLLTIIKREYLQGVRSKAFIISVVLGPVLMVGFAIVPGLLFGLKTGGATRLAIVDQTGRMYERVRESILSEPSESNNDDVARSRSADARRSRQQRQGLTNRLESRFNIEQITLDGRSFEEVKQELSERVRQNRLDAYLVLPTEILTDGEAEYYGRNLGDVITIGQLRSRLSRAVIEQRMSDAEIDQERVRELSKSVDLNTTKISEQGEEKDAGSGSFFLAIAVGTSIAIAVLMYGQVILSAVVEEKTTRLSEVLFSSVRPFPLMVGKLIGVSLVALTQYTIWAIVFIALSLYGARALAASGMDITIPRIAPSFVIYALLFFLIGFFVYCTIFAVVGAMVTSEKEASQVAIYLSFFLMIGIYLAFPVIRSPNSSYSFWVSMIPFFSPITMLVRIVTETPPFWQIALSLLIGFATAIGLIWVAARIYRIGMLMHGKRATIPEVLRWMRQV